MSASRAGDSKLSNIFFFSRLGAARSLKSQKGPVQCTAVEESRRFGFVKDFRFLQETCQRLKFVKDFLVSLKLVGKDSSFQLGPVG